MVPGVGLVVPGVSAPLPPMLEPEGIPEDEPPPDELPLLESAGMVPVLLPVPAPELFSFTSPELLPVVPAHALRSTAQVMAIIHLVINRSRKNKKAVRTTTTY